MTPAIIRSKWIDGIPFGIIIQIISFFCLALQAKLMNDC